MVTMALEGQMELEARELKVHTIAQSVSREHSFESLRVEGKIPEDLDGTLYRNGPGMYEVFGKAYQHMFEGDGAISAVRLKDGEAWGAVRVVESEGLKAERKAGKALYGYNVPWWRRVLSRKMKNTANTNVIEWQNRLFALMEGDKPTEISMEDLSTIGETDLGVIPMTFSAHPHFVPARQCLYNFGLSIGKETTLDLFELPLQGKARCMQQIPLRYPVMLHDFMATENHMVFFVSPVKLNIWKALLMLGRFEDLFTWDASEGTEVIVVPMDAPDKYIRFDVDPFFQFHFANGFERGEELIIDYVRYRDFSVMDELQAETGAESAREAGDWGCLSRARINPKTKTMTSEPLWDTICDFPRVHPSKQATDYRYLWLTTEPTKRIDGSKEPHQIVRFDMQSRDTQYHVFGSHEDPSEPVFVPRQGATLETDGYVLTLVYDAHLHTSHVTIMDANDIEKKPLAKVWFDQHIPTTFHGNWVPGSS